MNKIILALAAAVLLFSCQKEIDVKIPPHESKLVLYGVCNKGDTIKLKLSLSMGITSYMGQPFNVSDGVVILYDNGVMADTLDYDKDKEIYRSAVTAKAGHQYRVTASMPQLSGIAEATAMVPDQVDASVVITKNARLDEWGMPLAEVRVTFKDPANAAPDYYRLALQRTYINPVTTQIDYVHGCFEVTDASLEQLGTTGVDEDPCYDGENMYLRDLLFNGKEKEMRVYLYENDLLPSNSMNGDTLYTTVILEHYTEAYFRYLKSYRALQDNRENPFAEPTNVITNVKNGYGIFTLTSDSRYRVP